MLSSLNLGVKTQKYFVSSSNMFLDKKTLLKIWLNPGLNHLLRNRALDEKGCEGFDRLCIKISQSINKR